MGGVSGAEGAGGVPKRVLALDEAQAGAFEPLVLAERVRALFDRSWVVAATVFLASGVVAVTLWARVDPRLISAWLAALWTIAGLRLGLVSAYQRAPPRPADAARWARRFTAGSAASGVAWGLLPFLLHDALTPADGLFLAFVLGGLASAAALGEATHPPALLAFALPALGPAVALLLQGRGPLHAATGALLAVFALALAGLSRSAGRALLETSRLGHRNGALAARLAQQNAELQGQVALRTAELGAARERAQEHERHLAHLAGLGRLGPGGRAPRRSPREG